MTESERPAPLFCFGSLMDDAVLEIVTGHGPASLRIDRAIARNHLQYEVAEERFPILVAAPRDHAAGRLVHGLDALALDRVLFFEGEEYAQYFCDTGAFRTTGQTRDFDRWRRDRHDLFLDHTGPYMALFGAMSVTGANATWRALQRE